MNYDLILHVGAGVGMGHAMRIYALAQAAISSNMKVVVSADDDLRGLGWPCRTCGVNVNPAGSVLNIVDGTKDLENAQNVWRIWDGENAASNNSGGVIYPHYGMPPTWPEQPTLMGPQYYPIRSEIERAAHEGYKGGGEIYGWRIPDNHPMYQCAGMVHLTGSATAFQVGAMLRSAEAIICPPSVVAYEALRIGCPVILHHTLSQYDHISEAMIQAGVASDSTEMMEGVEVFNAEELMDKGQRRMRHRLGERRILPQTNSGAINILRELL